MMDNVLNQMTMYRMMLYGLGGLAAISTIFGFFGRMAQPGWLMIVSCIILIATCYIANKLLSILFDAPSNYESWLITALILFLILPVASTPQRMLYLTIAALAAMASKYVIAINHRHIFNPAAFGAATVSLTGLLPTTWWIGNALMAPFIILFGIAVMRKIRRVRTVSTIVVVTLAILLTLGLGDNQTFLDIVLATAISGPLLFFSTVMLTDPSSSPVRERWYWPYGILVGLLYAIPVHLGSVVISPILALLIGNLFAYGVNPKHRITLALKSVSTMGSGIKEFVFTPSHALAFQAGQYAVLTLPHTKSDSRGNRRSFTIASSPTESEVRFGVRMFDKPSSFKQTLQNLKPGNELAMNGPQGDFVLPKDTTIKLGFIAGGIGITPFRSMIKEMIDSKIKRDIVLVYVVADPKDFCYMDIFEQATSLGVKIIPLVRSDHKIKPWNGLTGNLTPELLKSQISDATDRLWYSAGPPGMVAASRQTLRQTGVKRQSSVTDIFTGY